MSEKSLVRTLVNWTKRSILQLIQYSTFDKKYIERNLRRPLVNCAKNDCSNGIWNKLKFSEQ